MDTPSTNGAPAGARPSGIDVAIALARVRLAETHFQEAMAFIEFTADELSAPRALSIYARLHHLSEIEYSTIKDRVLASFDAGEPPPPTLVPVDGRVQWDVTASVFRRMRRRLGGRRNLRLRKRVELFSGRVESALLDIHVDSVCRMMRHFDSGTSVAEVVRFYMESLEVRPTAYPTIYLSALAQLYDELEAVEVAAAMHAAEPENVTSAAEASRPITEPVANDDENADEQAGFGPAAGMATDLDLTRSGPERGRLRIVPGRAF